MSSQPYIYEGFYGYIVKSLPLHPSMEHTDRPFLLKRTLEVYIWTDGKWIKLTTPSNFIFITYITFKIYMISRLYSDDSKCIRGSFHRILKTITYRDLLNYQYYIVNSEGRILNDTPIISGGIREELRPAVPLLSFVPGPTNLYEGVYSITGTLHIPKGSTVNMSGCTVLFMDVPSSISPSISPSLSPSSTPSSSSPSPSSSSPSPSISSSLSPMDLSNLVVDKGGQLIANNVIFASASTIRNRVGGITINSSGSIISTLNNCNFMGLGYISDSGIVLYHPISIQGDLETLPLNPPPITQGVNVNISGCTFYGTNISPYISLNTGTLKLSGVNMDLSLYKSHKCLIEISGSLLFIGGTSKFIGRKGNSGIFNIPLPTRSFIIFTQGLILLEGIPFRIFSTDTIIRLNAPSFGLTGTITSSDILSSIGVENSVYNNPLEYIMIDIL